MRLIKWLLGKCEYFGKNHLRELQTLLPYPTVSHVSVAMVADAFTIASCSRAKINQITLSEWLLADTYYDMPCHPICFRTVNKYQSIRS